MVWKIRWKKDARVGAVREKIKGTIKEKISGCDLQLIGVTKEDDNEEG